MPRYTGPQLRKILKDRFKSDSDLDAFCLDNFPNEMKGRIANGMDQVAKITLLLQQVDWDVLGDTLTADGEGAPAHLPANSDPSPRELPGSAKAALPQTTQERSSQEGARPTATSSGFGTIQLAISLASIGVVAFLGWLILKPDDPCSEGETRFEGTCLDKPVVNFIACVKGTSLTEAAIDAQKTLGASNRESAQIKIEKAEQIVRKYQPLDKKDVLDGCLRVLKGEIRVPSPPASSSAAPIVPVATWKACQCYVTHPDVASRNDVANWSVKVTGEQTVVGPRIATPGGEATVLVPLGAMECKSELIKDLQPAAAGLQAPRRLLRETFAVGALSLEFVELLEGDFMMGAKDSAAGPTERPRPAHVGRFLMSTTEITQGLWQEVMGTSCLSARRQQGGEVGVPCDTPSEPGDAPVNKSVTAPAQCTSWYDAIAFCNALSKRLRLPEAYKKVNGAYQLQAGSKGFRLPTEPEWEYAARAGASSPASFVYSGSNDLNEVAWFDANSGLHSHDVCQKRPNQWGLYDMSGNAFEWVNDKFLDTPGVKDARVSRGGSWGFWAALARVSHRQGYSASNRYGSQGFRIAKDPD